jgi:Tfp pilus assembly protein PilF
MKRRYAFVVIILSLMGAGCQSSHQQQKQQAMARWQKARCQVMLDLARQQYLTGELDKAKQSAERARDVDPKNSDVHLLLGQIAMERNDLNQAKKSIEKSLELDGKKAQAQYQLGVVYERQNDLPKACEHYRQAWQGDPERTSYLRAMVETMVTQGQVDEAWAVLQANQDHVASEAPLSELAGEVLRYLGRNDESIAMYRAALNLQPDNPVIAESLAFSLYRTGQWEQALTYFESVENQVPNTAGGGTAMRMAMGDCYMQIGQYHRAQRCFEYVCQHDDHNGSAWSRLAQAALGRQDYDQASQNAERALELSPNQADAQLVLGYVALMRQDYAGAQKLFRQVIERDNKNILAYCFLGKSLQMGGQSDAARKCYQEALQLNPNDPLSRQLIETAQVQERPIPN